MSTTTQTSRVGAWLGRNVLLVIAVLALASAGWAYSTEVSEHEDQLTVQEARIAELEVQIDEAGAEADTAGAEAAAGVTGADPARSADDLRVIEGMMNTAATWTMGEAYVEAREEMMSAWGLDEGSQFMSVFMPGEKQGAYRTDSQGVRHFAYPEANSELRSVQAHLLSYDGDEYSYLAVASVRTAGSAGGTVTRTTAVLITVDGQGGIVSASAYPANSDALVSGSN